MAEDGEGHSLPGFFQPNFVQKSSSNFEEASPRAGDLDKSQSGFGDVPLKEWYMHGNF